MFTYFAQAGSDGPVKIGKAVDPRVRLNELQTGNPAPLRLICWLQGDVEADCHARFRRLHIRGEWFSMGPELAAFIQDHPARSRPPLDRVPHGAERVLAHLRRGAAPLTFAEAARIHFRIHHSGVHRLHSHGRKGRYGRRVRLDAAWMGGKWITTAESVASFLAALNGPIPAPTPSASAEIEARDAAVVRELDAAGI